MLFTEYIAVTKQISDKLGENTDGVDCREYYQKIKDLLQDYKPKHASHPNITKEEREAIKTIKEDDTHVVLTADKGVAMVVMDKSSYVDKCMTLAKPAKSTDKSRQHFTGSRENMVKNINGCNYTTTNCSLQAISANPKDSMIYPKFTRQIALCAPLFQLVGCLHTTWPNV